MDINLAMATNTYLMKYLAFAIAVKREGIREGRLCWTCSMKNKIGGVGQLPDILYLHK